MITKFIALYMSMMMMFTTAFGLGFKAPAEQAKEIKNVVIMIGDGMGYNHLYATQERYGVKLDMLERTQYHGEQRTQSANFVVTDSAAGGTALSNGVRTMNFCVGVYPADVFGCIDVPASITEIAMINGKSTGIVTSDSITGATPAAFSAHVLERHMVDEIYAQQLKTNIDLIWGSSHEAVKKDMAEKEGRAFVTDLSEVKALVPGQKSIGSFDCETMWQGKDNGDNPTLSELAAEALDILDNDPDGFFLMLEGAHIDKRSHKQDGEGAMAATLEFDKAIGKVLDYAEENKDTLVIITADHETGLVSKVQGEYKWLINTHSARNVPVLVYGSEGFMEEGEVMNNYEIPRRAVAFMTENKEVFPVPYNYMMDILQMKNG